MVHRLELFYTGFLDDKRISRAEAQMWMADKRDIGRSVSSEEMMWDGLERYADAFEPGVAKEVESFLAGEAEARYRKGDGFWASLGKLIFGEPDSDGDGLNDAQERKLNTNPFRRDTDGDGFGDGAEVARGTDPGAFIQRPGTR